MYQDHLNKQIPPFIILKYSWMVAVQEIPEDPWSSLKGWRSQRTGALMHIMLTKKKGFIDVA